MDIKAQLDMQAMYSAQAAEQSGTPGEPVAAASADLPTREDIAAMKKADLAEWLQAHGVEKPAGTVDELRAALTAIMFVELVE